MNAPAVHIEPDVYTRVVLNEQAAKQEYEAHPSDETLLAWNEAKKLLNIVDQERGRLLMIEREQA